MLKINTIRDPYGYGYITWPKTIEFKPGLTVLVGCNGFGKSTMLMNIIEETRSQKIPLYYWNNLNDGGSKSFGSIILGYGDFDTDSLSLGAAMAESSEGETILLNLNRIFKNLHKFIVSGEMNTRFNKISKDMRLIDGRKDEPPVTNKRILLFDAVDSGLSVDSIVDLKEGFEVIIEDSINENKELYIIIAANEYELARNSQCFDPTTGKYITFKDYEDYRKFILKSRDKKAKRLERIIERKEKTWEY